MGRIKDLSQYSGAIQRQDVWFMVDGDSFNRGQKMSAQQIYTLCKGVDGRNIEIQNSGTYIQWRLQGDASWTNLAQLSSLKGADGKQIEIQVSGGYIQTRLTGGEWANLMTVADLKGGKGDNAQPPNLSFQVSVLPAGSAATASVTGTYPNLTVALGIPKGQDAQHPNIGFSITALAPGSEATAGVTGIYPNLIVALGIPRGQDAQAPAFSVSAEGKPAGTEPEVALTGAYPNLALLFKIPAGLQGQQGQPLVVLPNGNYGNWDNGLGQYVDSGVAASANIVLDQTPVNFTEAEVRANIQGGEGVTALFGKIKKWLSDLGALAFKSKVDWSTDIDNKPTNVSAFTNDADYQSGTQVTNAIATIDFTPYEQTSNKVAISSLATATQYPTAKSVWDLIQDVIATIPAGGLKVPLSLDAESDLADPTTLEAGDYFVIQDMDVSAGGHTGRAWVNYTDPADSTTPLKYYTVVDQYFSADGTSIVQTGSGSLQVSTEWLTGQLSSYVTASRTFAGLNLSADRTVSDVLTALGITQLLTSDEKAMLGYLSGHTTVATLTNVGLATKRLIVATVSTDQTLSLTGVPPTLLAHILVKNSGGSDITVTLPTAGMYKSRVGDTATVPAGGSIEISVLYDADTSMYILSTVEDE